MFKKTLKVLLGIFTLPVCVGVSTSLYEHLSRVQIIAYYQQKWFMAGIIAYLVVHAVIFKPSYLYVLSHELMHAIAALLSGGRVRSIKVSSRGGSTAVTKSNIFIALSPYLIPFYTIIIAAVWFGIKFFTKSEVCYEFFLFAIGFTLTFHIVLTIDFLKIKQTDLLHAGYFFSICLIYIVNVIILAAIFSYLFKSMHFSEFIKNAFIESWAIYKGIFRQLFL